MKPKKLLSFILATVMAISLFPTFTITASAATTTTEKNITLGTSALSGYDSTNGYDYVYYGVYQQNEYTPNMVIENPQEDTVYTDSDKDKTEFIYRSEKYYKYEPIKWRILTMNGNDGTYYESTPYTPTTAPTSPVDGVVYTDTDTDNTKFIYLAKSDKYYKQSTATPMFLLSEYVLERIEYNDYGALNNGQTYPSDWRYSDAWKWCNDTSDNTSFISSSFTDSEKAHHLKTSKDNSQGDNYTDELKGDTFFFLSQEEVDSDYIKNDREAKISDESDDIFYWWLRSPDNDFRILCVRSYDILIYAVYAKMSARPAFNLNPKSVLFTSAANGGKSSTATVGDGTEIQKNSDYTISGDEKYEYKLTMLDTSRNFEVTQATVNGAKGGTVTFNYENATIGSNEYISAMIVDNNDEVLYYGQLAKATSASGEVSFNIPTDIDGGTYELRLFNEQINGNKKTDFSSAFQTVTLSIEKPINSAITLAAPVKNAIPQTSIETDEYTATVVWSPEIAEGGTFTKSTKYTATITITPKTNYTVSGIAENGYTLNGATSVTNAADSNVVTAVFPKTAGSSGGGSSITRYTVKFNTNGGNTIASQTVKKNNTATEPAEPTKDGYIFDGWYTDSKFTTEYDFDTKVTKNITLYAKWVEDEVQEPSDDKKDDNKDDKQKSTTDE